MAKQTLYAIKNWFKTGLKPSQQQFWDTWDSFWHKDDVIPAANVENLDKRLDEKADQQAFAGHLTDPLAHQALLASKANLNHTHTIAQVEGLQLLLNSKTSREEVLSWIDDYDLDIKDGVPEDGNTFMKLYQKIAGSFKEITVADLTARDAYNISGLPMNVFVLNDGDGRWALYKATTTGTNAVYIKISDPDLLNAAMSASQIKTAYESNPDTNAFTNVLLSKLNSLQNVTLASDAEVQLAAAVTEDSKVVSRLKLFNWWAWIKTQAQVITKPWTFNSGIILGAGTTTTPPLVIPGGSLTSALQNGAIERDANGVLWNTFGSVRNPLLSIATVSSLPATVPAALTFVYLSNDKCIYYSDGANWQLLVRSSVPIGGNTTNLIKTIRQVTADEYAALPASEKNADTLYISKGSPYNVITIPPPPAPVIINIGDLDLTDKMTIEYGRFYDCPANYSLPNGLFFQFTQWHQDKKQDVIVQIFHLNDDSTESKVAEYIGRGVNNWYFGEKPGIKIIKYIINPLGVKSMNVGIEFYYSLQTPKPSNFELNKGFINFFKNLQSLILAVNGSFVVNSGVLDCSELKELVNIGDYSPLILDPKSPPGGDNLFMSTISLHPVARIQSFIILLSGGFPDDEPGKKGQWAGRFSKIPENLADITVLQLDYTNISSAEMDRMLIDLDKAGRFNGRLLIENNYNGTYLNPVKRTSASNASKVSLLQKGWSIQLPE
ncbi:hypothetical protein HDF26_005213 [Pedobacter cryoconitis]|uniref:hypothetical protein n=1 Tax=Pedobacter cryoconitis TaxID=188932 RepID=UPI00161A4A75|nr:hypothetical protein [Pedobacter cryoconitis]MBB6274731.1 hypothetical protein [Pedobacter cryoconitis]